MRTDVLPVTCNKLGSIWWSIRLLTACLRFAMNFYLELRIFSPFFSAMRTRDAIIAFGVYELSERPTSVRIEVQNGTTDRERLLVQERARERKREGRTMSLFGRGRDTVCFSTLALLCSAFESQIPGVSFPSFLFCVCVFFWKVRDCPSESRVGAVRLH